VSIPRTFIDELVSRVDIVEIIDAYVKLRKAGKDYQACCPFHQEKTPSFTVSREKQFYYCFGCQASGNVISFLMEHGQLDFIEAIHELADRLGLSVPEESGDKHKPNRFTQTRPLYQLLTAVAGYYQQQLQQPDAQVARDYFQNRGLDSTTIQHFSLGYAADLWDGLLKKFPNQRDSLLQTGLLVEKEMGKVYDRFRHRVMFPIYDQRSRVIGFGGRVLDDSKPKYLNSPETPLFHKSKSLYGLNLAVKTKPDYLLIVEGYMDVVALQQHGLDCSVATLGTAATDDHLQRLFRSVHHIVFCFDGDKAGRKAAWKVLDNVLSELHGQRQVDFLFLPEGEDPDSLIRKEGKAGFQQRIDQAQPLSTALFERLLAQANPDQADWQARLMALAKPLLDRMPAGPAQEFLRDKLGTVDTKNLSHLVPESGQQVTQQFGQLQQHQTQQQGYRPKQVRMVSPMRVAIALLVQDPEQMIKQVDDIHIFQYWRIAGSPLLHQLLEFIAVNPHLNTGVILSHWYDQTEGRHLQKLAMWQHHLDAEERILEFRGALQRLAEQQNDLRLDELLQKSRFITLSEQEKQELTLCLSRT